MIATRQRERVLPRLIEEEMRESFLDYSMSVIVQRALPDVRDGLKPVHRRILYAMYEAGLLPTRPFKKSATVVGDVLGKYHPHGDASVYDSLVRMAQDFAASLRTLTRHPDWNPRPSLGGPVEAVEAIQAGRRDSGLASAYGHWTGCPFSSMHDGGVYWPPPSVIPPSARASEGAREAVSVGSCVHADRARANRRVRRFMVVSPA